MKKSERKIESKEEVQELLQEISADVEQDLTVAVVIDRSGSMWGIENDTIGGFNSFMEKQRKNKGKTNVTLTLFNTEYEFVHDNALIDEVKDLNNETYVASGGTALFDAIGKTIESIKKKTKKGDAVLFAILTDGEENSSREFDGTKILKMINAQTKKGWQFVYLAANQDAIATAAKMGINANLTCNFSATGVGMTKAMRTMNYVANGYRGYAGFSGYSGVSGYSGYSGIAISGYKGFSETIDLDKVTDENLDKVEA